MQPQQTSVNFERQFSCISQSKEKHSNSKIIAEHIAEFEARGGKIQPIPTGLGTSKPGKVIVSEEPEAMGTPRPSKSPRKTRAKTMDESPFVSLKEAAEILGCAPPAVTRRVNKGELLIAAISEGTGEKLVRRDAVLTLKKLNKQRKPKQ